MIIKTSIRFFDFVPVRARWSDDDSNWWYAATDVIQALTKSNNSRRYWNTFKTRHAEMLSLCDSNKERTLQGAWKKRAEFQLEIGKVVKQLQAKEKYIYIEKRGTEDNESI